MNEICRKEQLVLFLFLQSALAKPGIPPMYLIELNKQRQERERERVKYPFTIGYFQGTALLWITQKYTALQL